MSELLVIPPQCTRIVIPAESHVIVIPLESRTIKVEADVFKDTRSR